VLVVEGVTEARQLDRLARRVGFVMAPGYFDSV
jgi:hypothetical protein